MNLADERPIGAWPDPTPGMLRDPLFNAIWDVIKTWDINVPEQYVGYCSATGSHARAIFDAITALRATESAQDCEAAWKKLREYCTNGLPFYDNEDGWRTIADAVLRAANHRATEPAQVGDADRAFELWFFRDIVDDQRSKLIALMLGGAVAKEATNHGTQRLCLKYILKALRAQGRAEAQAECVALREAVNELLQYEGHHVWCAHGNNIDQPCVCGLIAAQDKARALATGDHRKEGA